MSLPTRLRLRLTSWFSQLNSSPEPASPPLTQFGFFPWAPASARNPTCAPAAVSFPAIHRHGLTNSQGTLLVGNGKIEFGADNGKDSFAASLSDISWGSRSKGEFYLLPRGGKELTFHSSSATAKLDAISQAARAH